VRFTAKRSSFNTDIIVEWRPFLPTNETRFYLAGYEVEYRVMGNVAMGGSVVVGGEEEVAVVRGITSADRYEVIITACMVQYLVGETGTVE
jgi:hypothetical protein